MFAWRRRLISCAVLAIFAASFELLADCPTKTGDSTVLAEETPGSIAFQQALFERDETVAMELLPQMDISSLVFESGNTPLHVLAETPITEPAALVIDPDEKVSARLMQAVLGAGADPNAGNKLFLSPLMVLAISRGDAPGRIELAEILLDGGAEIDQQDDVGNTALIYTAQTGSVAFITFLLEQGANVAVRNHRGDTALDVASGKSHSAVVELLASRNWSEPAN